jgi:hypothetical protein
LIRRSSAFVMRSSYTPRGRASMVMNGRGRRSPYRTNSRSDQGLANRFVDEGLRMEDHPGVIFRDGPSGRRAVLIGGPDVAEVIRAVMSARAAEPRLGADAIVALVQTNTGAAARLIDTALRYWAAYPDEIDAWITDTEQREQAGLEAWQRQQDLLAR